MKTRRRPARPPADGEIPSALDFNDDRAPPSGSDELDAVHPAERDAEAGRSSGERDDEEVGADDLTPETLLDDDPSRTPSARQGRDAADTLLSVVPASAIGAGAGLDEAELADLKPVGEVEAERLAAQSERHVCEDPHAEPAAAREARARALQQQAEVETPTRPDQRRPRGESHSRET